jgi:putative ABC transport system permease protein
MLAMSPGFAAVAILTLGLGIGSTTTIFSAVNAVLFRALPFRESDRLVILNEANEKNRQWLRNPRLVTALDWKQHARSFSQIELAVNYSEAGKLTLSDHADSVGLEFVSQDLLPLLGIKPVLGRNFQSDDLPFNASQTIILSYGFWQRRFGADPGVIGKSLTSWNGRKTIIGVLPPGAWAFPWNKDVDVWVALNLTHNKISPDSRWFSVLARLKPGVSLDQAQVEMGVLAARAAQDHPELNRGWSISVQPLRQWYFRGWKQEFYLLLGAVSFVLLISCANVANLLLSRAIVRQREIAIRASLGASPFRVARQLLTESVLLGVLGGVLGLLVALVGIRLFVTVAPEWFPRTEEIGIDSSVLLFTFAVSMATGILFGLAPTLQARKLNLVDALKEAGVRSGGSYRHLGRSTLVVAETALALVLTIGAGLLVNSFLRLEAVNPGFNAKNLLTAAINLDDAKHLELLPNDMKRVRPTADTFYPDLLERIEKSAGVRAVAMEGGEIGCAFRIIGQPDPAPGEQRGAMFSEVSANYIQLMQGGVLKGRALTEADNEHSQWVALVNQAMVRRYFSGKEPLGSLLTVTFGLRHGTPGLGVTEDHPREIVGVVGDMRHNGLAEDPPPAIYVPWRQHIWTYPPGDVMTHLSKTLLMRMNASPSTFAETLRRIVAEIDKDQTVSEIGTMDDMLSGGLAPWRFFMRLFGVFSVLAVSLALVGIYGVMSYTVARRAHEIAVRIALGAGKFQILVLVVGQGLKLTLIGLAIGLAGALALTRLIEHLLFGIKASDPATFLLVALLLAAVSMAASFIPALRATRVDPIVTLRAE